MQRTISHTWFFNHAPQDVWECLTDSTMLSQWLMENDFQPTVGHKFMFRSKPKVKAGFDGNIFCEVLEVVPMQKLSYTWRGGPGNGKITLDSVVCWTLTPKNNGTELTLEHSGFKGIKNYLAYIFMNKGWSKIIKKRLAARLDNEPSKQTAC